MAKKIKIKKKKKKPVKKTTPAKKRRNVLRWKQEVRGLG